MPTKTPYWDDVKEGQALPEVKVEKLTRTEPARFSDSV